MNNKALNTLVLGAGGNVSQGIIKALRKSGIPMRIIGACIWEFSKGLYMCDEAYICPYADDNRFVSWVVDFCNQHKIDIIFTGVEENIIQLAGHEDEIKNGTNTAFVSSTYDQLIVGQDKYLTCKFLDESGCNHPKYRLWDGINSIREFAREVGYPVIAKPRNGKSSKGIRLFKSDSDIEPDLSLQDYVMEQCIGDTNSEYTIGCYVDKHGILQGLIPMHRKLWNGTTVWAKTVDNADIAKECEKICMAFKPRGPLNIQLRIDTDGKPVCFELNVRYSGTTAIRSHFGFMDVKAAILEYIYDEDISGCFKYRQGEAFRFDDELYLDAGTTDIMKNAGMIADIKRFMQNSD